MTNYTTVTCELCNKTANVDSQGNNKDGNKVFMSQILMSHIDTCVCVRCPETEQISTSTTNKEECGW